MSECHRILRTMGRQWACAKHRSYSTLKASLPSNQQWLDVWSLLGPSGGMEAREVSWHTMCNEHLSCAEPLPPKSMNHIVAAQRDVKRLRHHALRTGKRKSAPRHSIPIEVIAMGCL